MYKILMHEYSDCCDKNAYILLNFIYLYFVYFVYFVYLVYFSVNPKGNITSTGGRIFVKYTSAICNTWTMERKKVLILDEIRND